MTPLLSREGNPTVVEVGEITWAFQITLITESFTRFGLDFELYHLQGWQPGWQGTDREGGFQIFSNVYFHWQVKSLSPIGANFSRQGLSSDPISRGKNDTGNIECKYIHYSVCEEGPGVFAYFLTICSVLLILATLPFSLFMVVKVVQVRIS